MREIRPSGSEGGGAETNRFFLPLSLKAQYFRQFCVSRTFFILTDNFHILTNQVF